MGARVMMVVVGQMEKSAWKDCASLLMSKNLLTQR